LSKVLTFLDSYGIKAILDLHNYRDMRGDFGSQKWFENWRRLAEHFKDDSRIAAYELFNEPGPNTWDASVADKMDVLKAYAELTDIIHSVDPNRIVIWPSKAYLPYAYDLDRFAETVKPYLKPNVVFTVHRWYRSSQSIFDVWTVKQISYITVNYLIELRRKLNVPCWLGEFGSHPPFNVSNPEYTLTEQLLNRCQEQLLGWNLWMPFTNRWDGRYLEFFPLKTYSVRQPWRVPFPNLSNYIVETHGVDRQVDPWYVREIGMWHNNDYVTFKPRIIIRVVVNRRLTDGTVLVVSDEIIEVSTQLTIRNEEGTETHPGDWNTKIYSIGFTS